MVEKVSGANAQNNIEKIAALISELTVVEVCDLVKHLEEQYGVSAQAAVAVAPAAGAGGDAAPAAEQKEPDTVLLKKVDNKIAAIKVVRAITGLGLKEAKELVEKAPVVVKDGLSKEDVENFTKQLEEAGCEVETK